MTRIEVDNSDDSKIAEDMEQTNLIGAKCSRTTQDVRCKMAVIEV